MIEHFLNAVGASQPPERYGESFGAAKGNTAGGLLADSRSLVKGEGLRIATWARPPRLTCGANMEYHYPSIPRVMAKQSAGLLVRQKWIARCKRNTASGPAGRGGASPTGHGAFPCVACRGGNVPVVLDIRLSRCMTSPPVFVARY